MTYTFSTSVRGASHYKSGLPCQDASFASYDAQRGISIALVSDGHGDKRCYRSDVGSWLATEVAQIYLLAFAQNFDSQTDEEKRGECLRQLFSSIVEGWKRGVAYDLNIPVDMLTHDHLLIYGCTLIGYLQTPKYALGFQIGDGKLLVRGHEDGEFSWRQPVPWDDDCFANVTTSLCSDRAAERFRYHYFENEMPSFVFLGSDGIDDTFGDGEGLERFYMHVIDSIITDGIKTVERQMPQVLNHYSEVGSHDDMSVACVVNV